MATVYILLGGNIGKVKSTFEKAIIKLQEHHMDLVSYSSIYTSVAWGYNSENTFLNQVIEVQSELSPDAVLEELLKIEKEFGRERSNSGYKDRTLDLDILLYDDLIIETSNLEIPHPRMHLRKFTLVPLTEIASSKKHPKLNLTIKELLNICNDPNNVERA